MSDSLPQGIELTSLDEAFRNNPYALLELLRAAAPVHQDTQLKRYICTRHDDVKNLLRDKDLFTDPRKANAGSFAREFLLRDNEEPSMLLMDEPDHRRLRSLVTKPFTPAAVEGWRPRIRAVISRILDDIDSAEFDLIEHFAGPVPAVVIAEMLGIDPQMHGQFKCWSSLAVKISFNPFPSDEDLLAGREAMSQLESFFRSEIESRRAALGSDLISDMIRAEEAGDKLSVDEIVGQCNLLLVAGNVTTSDLIGNSIKALLDNPDQLASLREKPDLIQNTVEEALRFDSPVTNSGRIANKDFELAGCPIKKGESLMTSLAAANRDPAVYPDPNKFDIEREDTHHQSFGGGRHLCLGAHLARLEVQEAILALLDRYPNLAHSEKGYEYASTPSFRGLSFFWVTS